PGGNATGINFFNQEAVAKAAGALARSGAQGRSDCRSELDRIVFESIGFFCPGFTDGFERREPIQSLETLGEVVGVEECLDVLAKLVVAVVVVATNSRLFESTVHPLDLPVRPRMIWLCQPMLNPVRSAEQIEHMGLPPRSRA